MINVLPMAGNRVLDYMTLCIPQREWGVALEAPPMLKPVTPIVPRPMIHLAHVRDRQAAQRWLARRRRHLEANPVPLLIVTVSEDHQTMRRIVSTSQVGGHAFIVDASGFGSQFMVPADTLVLDGAHRLSEATDFIARAHRSSQRLDVLLIDDAVRPDLRWCEPHLDTFEALL